MYIQKVLKGITGITKAEADNALLIDGIQCNWWRDVHSITPHGVEEQLTERNLYWHLERYDKIDPNTSRPFHETTPFISTTAGAIERDRFRSQNIIYPPFL